jgi:hypothetical protein
VCVPELLAEVGALEETEDGLGITDVDCQEHGASLKMRVAVGVRHQPLVTEKLASGYRRGV